MRQDIRPSFSGPRGQARKTAQANSLPGSVLISAIIAINSISANVLIAVIIISSLSGAATYQEEGWQQGMTGVLTQPLLTAQRQQVVVWKQKKKKPGQTLYITFFSVQGDTTGEWDQNLNRYHHENFPVNYIHQDSLFSQIVCLNVQISHYLLRVKVTVYCIYFVAILESMFLDKGNRRSLSTMPKIRKILSENQFSPCFQE